MRPQSRRASGNSVGELAALLRQERQMPVTGNERVASAVPIFQEASVVLRDDGGFLLYGHPCPAAFTGARTFRPCGVGEPRVGKPVLRRTDGERSTDMVFDMSSLRSSEPVRVAAGEPRGLENPCSGGRWGAEHGRGKCPLSVLRARQHHTRPTGPGGSVRTRHARAPVCRQGGILLLSESLSLRFYLCVYPTQSAE